MAKQKSRTNHAHSEPARQPRGSGRRAGTAGRSWRWPAIGTLLTVVVIGIYLAWPRLAMQSPAPTAAGATAESNAHPALDPANAPITIAEYADFGCSSCQAWHRAGILSGGSMHFWLARSKKRTITHLQERTNMRQWLQIACERAVVRRASASALIVGALLIAINHGDALLAGDISFGRLVKIGLTILVPYVVSTVSSVAVLRDLRRGPMSRHLETPH